MRKPWSFTPRRTATLRRTALLLRDLPFPPPERAFLCAIVRGRHPLSFAEGDRIENLAGRLEADEAPR